MENITNSAILLSLIGIVVGIIFTLLFSYIKNKNSDKKAENIIEAARKTAEKKKREGILETKEEIYKLKVEYDKEVKERKQEIEREKERITGREEKLDRRDESLQSRENTLLEKEQKILDRQSEIQKREAKVEEELKKQLEELEKIAKYSKDQAKEEVMKRVEKSMDLEIASYIKEREETANLEVDKKAKAILAESMQKYASDVANEQTVTVVNLPSDDMKGRIIGREGRNIRTLEAITGVDLIVDDTPEAVVLSSFDPMRREIARLTLEALIKDGRIHPGRIEEIYDKKCTEVNAQIKEYGENALFELGITKVAPELIETLGKLQFRTSYGQNALQHSKEVAELAGLLAMEIGEDIALAKRAGLFHDLGKALDHETEGSHVEIGAELAKKYNEDEVVINGILSHHGDNKATSIISELVGIADALSASRPGARSDSLENYIKRLKQLEEIANDQEGVEKSYAMQAGREVRVIVKPEQIDDLKSYQVARDIKTRIEKEMKYPGTIKVIVIRETRAEEEAK